jgi:putative membrane protein
MIERANRLHAALSPFDRSVVLLIIAWVLAMISLPILRWGLGESALPIGISVGVLLQLMLVLAILLWTWGGRRTALVVAVIVVCAWLVEYIGHTTGFPFGGYAYTERLQPQVGGVPLLIPLAWLMMLPPSWAVAGRRAGRAAQGRLAFVIVSALAFTAWDLFLDPQMVGWNLWVWTPPSSYFGIP